MTSQSGIPIKDGELFATRQSANHIIQKVTWDTRMTASERTAAIQSGWAEDVLPKPSADVSLHRVGYTLSNDALLFSNDVNTVMDVVRDGIAVAIFVEDYVGKLLDIEELNQANHRGTLSGEQQNERAAKLKTLAAIRLFVLSYYVTWHLHDFHIEDRAGMKIAFPGLPEMSTNGPESATKCALYYYGTFVKNSGLVNSALELIQFTAQYFEAILEELDSTVIPSLRFAEVFTGKKFVLEGSDFALNGFERDYASDTGDAVVKDVDFTDIIGNHKAKSVLQRILQMLFLYDIDEQNNPISAVAGFPSIVLMEGKPGTGKTLMIAAAVTRAFQYAKQNGMPLRIRPLPRDLISKYQGISGERMKRYMDSLRDPKYVTIAYADDAEHYFQDRGGEQVSEGVKAVTNEFLVGTEGAQAIEYGNLLFLIATNYAEMIDGAVMNRIQERFQVNGAETENDYIDYIALELRKTKELFPDVIKLKHPKDYELWSDQLRAGPVREDKIELTNARSERIAGIVDEALQSHRHDEYRFYGRLLKLMQREYPAFSLRDVRNIMKAAKMELAGFDIPEAWTIGRQAYIERPYQEKVDLLVEEMREYLRTHDVDFELILRNNVVRYCDSYESIAGAKRERAIKRRVEDLEVQTAAMALAGKAAR